MDPQRQGSSEQRATREACVVSKGTVGHPVCGPKRARNASLSADDEELALRSSSLSSLRSCAEPCRYVKRKGGCRDGPLLTSRIVRTCQAIEV